MPVAKMVEISDSEFERCLEVVFDMWAAHRDTVDIAEACGITEAQADHVLACAIDGTNLMREEASDALRCYFGSKDWAIPIVDDALKPHLPEISK